MKDNQEEQVPFTKLREFGVAGITKSYLGFPVTQSEPSVKETTVFFPQFTSRKVDDASSCKEAE